VITENLAIQTYLARRYPAAGLLPTGPLDVEITALELQSWFASTVHPLVRQLRVPKWYSEDPSSHTTLQTSATSKLASVFAILEARLKDSEWLFDEWSLLDVYFLWAWFRATGSGFDGSGFPNCAAHAAKCETRPSVRKVLQREEEEFVKLREAGQIVGTVPDYQVGYAPVAAA
jgi:glutathione S-transferase